MKKRTVQFVEREFESVVERQESKPRCERCRRAQRDFHSERAKELGKDDSSFEGVWRCYDEPVMFHEMYGTDEFDEIEPSACEDCDEFDPSGLAFPMEVSDILYRDPELRKPLGAEIGSIVAVRPCKAEFGGKTYLGVLAGEIPVRTGLSYDRERGELLVYTAMDNPLIIIPELNAAVYGYESWWQVIETPDDLEDITDEVIGQQPYMAALAMLCTEGGGATD